MTPARVMVSPGGRELLTISYHTYGFPGDVQPDLLLGFDLDLVLRADKARRTTKQRVLARRFRALTGVGLEVRR